MKLTKKDEKTLAKGEIVFKGNLVVFDASKNVWQTMSRKHLNVNPSMTDEEFEAQCELTNECCYDSWARSMKDDFHLCSNDDDEYFESYRDKLGEI